MNSIILTTLELGLIYSLVVFSALLTSVLLKYDDLAIEASFSFGGATCASLLMHGVTPFLTPVIALCAGAFVGLSAGLLHTKLKLNNIITGIILIAGFFSLNLIIGGANLPLINVPTIFLNSPKLLILIFLIVIAFLIISWLLKTEVGFLIKASGTNSDLVESLGKSSDFYKIITLMISNALTALAGALFVQYTGFYSIWSGIGILVIALTGLIIAQMFSCKFGISLILGAIIYQMIITITLTLDVPIELNKLITAILLILLILLHRGKNA
ncbi:MAG: hypothetical protein P4L22_00245 [Candidatus Babeliales bacterium]|nr:hypothetical protein [Candidatus Babeliales bacterium]